MLWAIEDHRDNDPEKIVWMPVKSVHAAISLEDLP